MRRLRFVLLMIVVSFALATCGDAGLEAGSQATQAPPPQTVVVVTPPPQTVVIVTPPPPPTDPAQEPTAGVDLVDLRLEADGSGDLPTLEEALVESEVGATITLGPGTYRLDRPITAGGSLHLVGAGRDLTEILSAAPDRVLGFQGDGPFTATGIAFRHEGEAPADVVVVDSGEVSFADCRFTGGAWTEEAGAGSGLALGDAVSGEVSGCESVANELYGILLWDRAQVVLRDNVTGQNGDSGIAFFGNSGGKVVQNEVLANARYGIYVDEWAAPTVEGNTLDDNGEAGIAYFGNAAGMARDNDCSGDGSKAIYVGENAAPWLEDNTCELEGTVAEGQEAPAATGQEIVYAAWRDDNEDIYAMYADNTGVVRLTDDPARDNTPAWSPDGTRIAFVSERDGNREVYVMNADGSDQTRLTYSSSIDDYPAWSPDGSQIAYSPEGEGWGVFLISPEGGQSTRISPEGMGGSLPSWSPDGERIVLTIYVDRKPLLAILDPDSGELISLTRGTDHDYGPDWSPDGERITFVSSTDEEGNWIGPQIYSIDANGLGRTRLTHSEATDTSPSWSPDGTQIVFSSTRDGYGAIYRMNADGSGLTRVSRGSDPSSHPDWSPVASPPRGPRFNPSGDPWCFRTPEVDAAGDWQVVAPREPVLPGDRAEIGLRNNSVQAGLEHQITVQVIAPDETRAVAASTAEADNWVSLVYPDDFSQGTTAQRGAYTILWEMEGQFVACDGFVVAGGASP